MDQVKNLEMLEMNQQDEMEMSALALIRFIFQLAQGMQNCQTKRSCLKFMTWHSQIKTSVSFRVQYSKKHSIKSKCEQGSLSMGVFHGIRNCGTWGFGITELWNLELQNYGTVS